MSGDLKSLFKPKSIAVVGVSTNKAKLGRIIFDNIKTNGFKGRLWGVNIKGGQVDGYKLFKNLSEIKSAIDLAVVAIPAVFVPQVVQQAVDIKVKHLIIISAGFKESGPSGLKLENQIKTILKTGQTRLLGVNCLGLMSQPADLNATFVKTLPNKDSGIAFMSQSGAFGAAVLDKFQTASLGLRYFVSLGNKTDLDELDFIEHWSKEKQVKIIAAYLEDIKDGVKFIKSTRQAVGYKPIIMIIPGRSREAKQAITSHTGSLVKDSQIISLALKKAGVTEVSNFDELFTYLKIFTKLADKQVLDESVIITNAGGPAILAVDLLIKHGFKITQLDDRLVEKLKTVLPAPAGLHNPIDVLGDAGADRYLKVIKVLKTNLKPVNYFTILTPQLTTQPNKTARIIIDNLKTVKTPAISFFIGGQQVKPALSDLNQHNMPAFDLMETAIKAMAALRKYQNQKVPAGRFPSLDLPDKLKPSLSRTSGHLDPIITARLIHYLGLKVPLSLYHRLDQIPWQRNLKSIAKVITGRWSRGVFPVVAKLVSKNFSHSSDLKAVRLNIHNQSQLVEAVYQLLTLSQNQRLNNKQTYICLQEQVDRGLEMIAGLKRTDNFGWLFILGSGGVLTELYRDIKTIILPSSQQEILSNLKQTKIYQLITGWRGGQVYDINHITKALYQLTGLPKALPNLKTADFNPLIVNRRGVYIVDAEIYLDF